MKMEAGLDTGDMLLKCRRPLPADMTGGELHDLLAADGAQLLSETLGALQAGTLRPQKQDDSQSCYAPMLNKSLSPLDWTKPAAVLHNQVRGLNPWPCATLPAGQPDAEGASNPSGGGLPGGTGDNCEDNPLYNRLRRRKLAGAAGGAGGGL